MLFGLLKIESRSWLPNNWLKSTLPILEDPGLTTSDLQGSSFLVHHNEINYIITARHVIEDLRDPMIGFHADDRNLMRISSRQLNSMLGLQWVTHPNGLDLTAMPFPIRPWMDVVSIDEPFWNKSHSLKKGNLITHLGYPEGTASSYFDGSTAYFAVSMPGIILDKRDCHIITQTSGLHGASGGPLFLKPEKISYPSLIGVVITAKKNMRGEYLQKTTSIEINQIKLILESRNMNDQVRNFEEFQKGIDEMRNW